MDSGVKLTKLKPVETHLSSCASVFSFKKGHNNGIYPN